MKAFLLVLSAAAMIPCAAQAEGPDLSKIDRTIGKEPAYKGKPKYCLVVFGLEAKTRVWLVVDGEGANAVLYADRDADGNLTGKDERFPMMYAHRDGFRVGTIAPRDGGDRFSLEVEVKPGRDGKEDSYKLWFWPPNGRGFLQRTEGILLFADRPKEAPVVHFGGPLTLTILDWHKPLQPRQLVRDGKNNPLSILVGTPVFGGKHEAFATIHKSFRVLAGDKGFPAVEIQFPGKDSGAKPILARAEVMH